MSLFSRAGEVNDLARRVQSVTKAKNKFEAVRIALLHELERARPTVRDEEYFELNSAADDASDDLTLYMLPFMNTIWEEPGTSATR